MAKAPKTAMTKEKKPAAKKLTAGQKKLPPALQAAIAKKMK